MYDVDELLLEFKKNTKESESNGRFNIDCVKGLWGVSAPTKEDAKREAMHYFIQYFTDGEYT